MKIQVEKMASAAINIVIVWASVLGFLAGACAQPSAPTSAAYDVVFANGMVLPWLSSKTGQETDPNAWPLPDDAFSHPRSAGTFTRFLAHYVRERNALSLSEALAKTSYLPAKYLQETAPQMKKKGRLQEGMDADITVLGPATVQDRATYERPNQTSVGIKYLLVNGQFVIREGELDTKAFPVGRCVAPSPHNRE